MNLANTIKAMYESKEQYDAKKDHDMDPKSHVVKNKETGMFCVYNVNNKKVAEFETKDEAEKYAVDNHDDLMKKDDKKDDLDEAFEKAFDDFLAEEESLDEALIGDLKKVEDAMMGTKNKEQGIQAVMDVMKVNKKKATHLVNRILKLKGSQRGKVTFKEANMSDVKKQLGKVKGLSKDAYNQLITLPMPVLTTMVNQLSGLVASYDMKEEVELDENLVMKAQFKVGDMPNSDLHTSIEKLKTAKKKAEAQKPKVSDPVLVKSLDDVISEIDKTIKGAEKVQSSASKAIAKVAPSIKKTFELISRKKYLMNSTEVEGDQQLDEAFNIDKGTNVKMKDGSGKDLYGKVIKKIKVNGKPAVTVQWKSGVKGNFRMDQFAAASMDRKADYQVKDDGVRFDQKEGVELEEAKSSSGYELYHRDFSGAMQHAYAFAKKKGYVVDKDDIDQKVAFGPKKPSSGKTNKYILDTNKKQNVHIQVANLDNKRYELNMYIESVELEEDYFMVQYYDKKGKADTTKFSKFDNEQKAKKYLDRANKAEKEGEYKMFKVKGKMESTEMNESDEKYTSLLSVQIDEANKGLTPYLKKAEKFMMPSKNKDQGIQFVMKGMKVDKEKATEIVDTILKIKGGQRGRVTFRESNENFFGTAKNHGISDSLLDAVNAVVTGQAETVEVEPVQEPEQIDEDNTNNKSDDGEGLDKVQPKAVKKKFKDRKDKDIDNDGDVDSSDKFLHKKRKAISKAIDKDDSEEKNLDKEEDKKDVKSGKKEKVDLKPKLDENFFKKKYGNRWERVMEATATKLAMKKD